jgi:GNAT superfamily N-acetyltransferase
MSGIHIRLFGPDDVPRLVEILTHNGQYGHPEIEGPAAMRRFDASGASVFLVAEAGSRVAGFLRATYDGSRAMIHVLSVDPDFQTRGVGRTLVEAAERELRRRGAPGAVATVTEKSARFWEKMGYASLPVHLMLKEAFSGGTGDDPSQNEENT